MPASEIKKQPIFVLGHARSGTTLLQRLLNSYEDVLIWGEHQGVLVSLSSAFYRGIETKLLFEPPKVDWRNIPPETRPGSVHHWLRGFDKKEWVNGFRNFLDALFIPEGLPGKNFWGFKEVWYGENDRVIEFLQEIYPDAYFVFIIRDVANVLASKKRSLEYVSGTSLRLSECKSICRRWLVKNNTYYKWHSSGGIRSFWVRYEDLIQGQGGILEVLRQLGKSFGKEQLAVLRSECGRVSSFDDDLFNTRWKTLPYDWRVLASSYLERAGSLLGYENIPCSSMDKILGRSILTWARGQELLLKIRRGLINLFGAIDRPAKASSGWEGARACTPKK